MLKDGPVADVFRAHEARLIYEAIGSHAAAVNASKFGRPFTAFQAYAVEQFVLAVARLFDPPKKLYQLRSVPAVLKFVEDHASELPLSQRSWLQSSAERIGAWDGENSALEGEALLHATAAKMRGKSPSIDNNEALEALRALRDKKLAHPEHIEAEGIQRTQWEPAIQLVDFAQHCISALGAITATAYCDGEGRYFLADDAAAASLATIRLMREVGIAPKANVVPT